MEKVIRSLWERDVETIGRIERHPDILANKPVIMGTRIPVKSIHAFDRAGYSIDQIREQYPTLTVEDIKAALAFSVR